MERDYLKYIEKFLGESALMAPSPTLLKPYIRADPSIKAVVVDVYGTIIISASGDIDESEISTENLKAALNAAGIKLGVKVTDYQLFLGEILETFKSDIIRFHEEERTDDRPYPEVDILKIWEKILFENRDKELLILDGELCVKCFTFVFEVLCNRIYPMPGMKEVITRLNAKGLPLGIISNAQFYTPVILNYFMHGGITEGEEVKPFDPDLTVFSYKFMRSKPDHYLFEAVKQQCWQKYKIFASEILFLGNDMFRDIYPASLAGFKTALFAGDIHSLRMRKEKPEISNLTPDFVVTDLHQLLNIVE